MKLKLLLMLIACSYHLQSEAFIDLNMFYNQKKPFVEITFNCDKMDLKYDDVGNTYSSNIVFNISVKNLNTNKVDSMKWNYSSKFEKDRFNSINTIIAKNMLNLGLNSSYQIDINAVNDGKVLTKFTKSFNTPEINVPIISDLILAYEIKDSLTKTMFQKGKFYILPNSSNLIIGEEAKLCTYQEFYNFDNYLNKTININYVVQDGAKREVFSQSKKVKVTNPSFIDIYENILFSIPTGSYFLKIEAIDESEKKICNSSKLFFLSNPNQKPEMANLFNESRKFESSIFSSFSNEEVDDEFEKFSNILTDYEIDQFKKLVDYKAKKRALFKFWSIRDSDTLTVENEKREEFIKLVRFAENNFLASGWKSERGRIVLKYGLPTVRNEYLATSDKIACEEWFYDNVGGGLYFYFVQRYSPNNFILVHSNARNEPRDPNWVSTYKPNIVTDGTSKFQDTNNYQK